MTPEELKEYFGLAPHAENGAFSEQHYGHFFSGRASSGSIFYYVGPEEITEFHRIDCDEYWCYSEGVPLDVWLISEDGKITVKKLGTDKGCEPFVYVPKGTLFASRHSGKADCGTFLVCITVPRFDPSGFELISKEELLEKHPEAAEFYK